MNRLLPFALGLLAPLALTACSKTAPAPTPAVKPAAQPAAVSADDPSAAATTPTDDTAPPSDPGEPTEGSGTATPPEATAPVPTTLPADAPPAAIDIASLPGEPITELATTDSGLQYADLVAGDGPAVPAIDTTSPEQRIPPAVRVHYTGWKLDGTKFDSSHDRGEPIDFLITQVIRGWTEGVGSMSVGGKRKLVIPGNLAYGPQGQPRAGIGPNETLVFDVELLGVDYWAGIPDPLPGEAPVGDAQEFESGLRVYPLAADPDLVPNPRTDAPAVTDDSLLTVHFKMFRPDGELLNDTTTAQPDGQPGQPGDLPNRQLFPGWREGVAGMKPGERRKLVIPWDIGFGPNGDPRAGVPPKATVTFDLTLIDVDRWEAVPDPLPGEPVTGEPITTESGLVYYDLVVGEGDMPATRQSKVQVRYAGFLNDGTKFDGTADGAPPSDFGLDQVIVGWTEGVASMRVGGKRKLVVPFDLGYGPTGRRPRIPPRATLVFDIELIAIPSQ